MISHAIISISTKMPTIFSALVKLYFIVKAKAKRDLENCHWLAVKLANQLDVWVPQTVNFQSDSRLTVPINDAVGREIYLKGAYEPEIVSLVKRLLKPGDTFLDIGAHVGQYTVLASKIVGEAGRVISFEVNPKTAKWLRKNIKQNKLTNVSVHEVGLYSASMRMQLHLGPSRNIGAASLVSRPNTDFSKPIWVDTVKLDSVLAWEGIHSVSLIKVDIEGAEYEMLKGASSIFKMKNRPSIIMELNPRINETGASDSDVTKILHDNGYVVRKIEGRDLVPLGDNETGYCNVLAIPKETLTT